MKYLQAFFSLLASHKKTSIALFCVISLFSFLCFFLLSISGPMKPLLSHFPSIGGIVVPKTYLVALQNNSEIRPGGGFISAFAIVDVWFGIPSIHVFDSYVPPAPNPQIEPPYPLNEILSTDTRTYQGWQVRDANWSPDMPTSAQKIMNVYKLSVPSASTFDGVFTLDITALEWILSVVGPITIGKEVFTSKNFFHKTQRMTKSIDLHNQEELQQRKSILGELTPILFRKMLNPFRWEHLMSVLDISLQRKHLLLWFSNDSIQKTLHDHNWDGSFTAPDPDSDTLGMVIGNIGGRKADRYLSRNVSYDVFFDRNGQGHAKATLRIQHQGTRSLSSDFYQGWIRIFTSSGSTIQSSPKKSVLDTELGFTTIGTLVHLQPGEEQVLTYSWDLPSSITPNNYQLALKKQPGQWPDIWQISLTVPTDFELNSSQFSVRENIGFWKGSLKKDTLLRAQSTPDTLPPIPVWQRFTNKNFKEIEVRFSELLGSSLEKNPENISIIDTNYADSYTNNVEIQDVQIKDQTLRIRIGEISMAKEERYTLSIKDVTDLSGNMISPNPLILTIVQR